MPLSLLFSDDYDAAFIFNSLNASSPHTLLLSAITSIELGLDIDVDTYFWLRALRDDISPIASLRV